MVIHVFLSQGLILQQTHWDTPFQYHRAEISLREILTPYLAFYILNSNGVCNQVSSHSAKGILIGTITGGSMLVIVIVGACLFLGNKARKLGATDWLLLRE